MSHIVLGPCRCQGCGLSVYWGVRLLRDGTPIGDRRWRELSDGMPHICLGVIA